MGIRRRIEIVPDLLWLLPLVGYAWNGKGKVQANTDATQPDGPLGVYHVDTHFLYEAEDFVRRVDAKGYPRFGGR